MPTDAQQAAYTDSRIAELEEAVRKLKSERDLFTQVFSLVQVDAIEIGKDFFRGSQGFLQISAPSNSRNALFIVNELLSDPTTATRYARLHGTVPTSGTASLSLTITSGGDNKAILQLVHDSVTGAGAVQVEPKLEFFGQTSDPGTLVDGDVWFRSNTFLYHARANGVTETFAFLSDLTSFLEAGDLITVLDGTAWRTFYTDASGNVTELALGAAGTVLRSAGASSAPSFAALDSDDFTGTEWTDLTDGGETILHSHAAAGGGMNVIVQEADQTVNSGSTGTTLVNSELLFAVGANEVWQFEGIIVWESGATPDIDFTVVGPAGAVGAFTMTQAATQQAGQLGDELMFNGSTIPFAVRFWGAIHNGANAGNCTVQFAQNTSDAGNTTVYAGSYLKYQQET